MKEYEDFCDLLSILFLLLFMKMHIFEPPLALNSVLYEDTNVRNTSRECFYSSHQLVYCPHASILFLFYVTDCQKLFTPSLFPIDRVGLSTPASLFVYELLK